MGPGRKASVSLKRSVRSETQPFTANWAGQMTSPMMMSMSPPPAWNSVRNLSKYWPVSEGITRCLTLTLLLCWLNCFISFGSVPVSSGPKERINSPESLLPPPQAALPRSAAPARPAPPIFRKSLRLRSRPNVFCSMFSPYPGLTFPRRPRAGPLIMPEKRSELRVAFFEQRKLRVLGLLVCLRSQPRTEVGRRHPTLRETGHVRPGLFRPHLETRVYELAQQRVVQVHRPAGREINHLEGGAVPEQILENPLDVLQILARREAVVYVDHERIRDDVLGPPTPRERRCENLVERQPLHDDLFRGTLVQQGQELPGPGQRVLPLPGTGRVGRPPPKGDLDLRSPDASYLQRRHRRLGHQRQPRIQHPRTSRKHRLQPVLRIRPFLTLIENESWLEAAHPGEFLQQRQHHGVPVLHVR